MSQPPIGEETPIVASITNSVSLMLLGNTLTVTPGGLARQVMQVRVN